MVQEKAAEITDLFDKTKKTTGRSFSDRPVLFAEFLQFTALNQKSEGFEQ